MNTQHHATDDTAGLIGPDDKLISGCNGDCAQDRKPCPCPQACQIPQDDRGHVSGAKPLLLYFAIGLTAICAAIGRALA
jgi:hypothetical protein